MQFLQASPENPFCAEGGGPRKTRNRRKMGDDPRNQADHMGDTDPMSRTYAAVSNSQHLGLAPETEASPQSGANKVTLYSQL